MSAAGWWWSVGIILGWLTVAASIGVTVGKVIRNRDRQHDAGMADFDRQRIEDPAEQWCCYQGRSPDDAVWRVTEMGDTGRNLLVLRARNMEGAKVSHRPVTFGSWQEFPVARTSDAEDGAA